MDRATSYAPLSGEHFVRGEFNLILLLICAIILRNYNRHLFFSWLIAVLPPVYVCYGTIARIDIIHNKTLDPATVEHYLILALASWIACIITDGTYAINLYNDIPNQRLHMQYKMWSWEMSGPIATLLVMLKFGFDVYHNFHPLISDKLLYIYFFSAVIAKIGKIFIQGTVLLTNRDYLKEHPTLTAQLLITDILAMVQVLFLFRFTPVQKWSMCILLVVDILNRLYQCCKLAFSLEKFRHLAVMAFSLVKSLVLLRWKSSRMVQEICQHSLMCLKCPSLTDVIMDEEDQQPHHPQGPQGPQLFPQQLGSPNPPAQRVRHSEEEGGAPLRLPEYQSCITAEQIRHGQH